MGASEREAPEWLRILWPSNSPGQMGMTRKECGRNHPARLQRSGRGSGGKEGVPSIPVTEIVDGTVGSK